jgi:hypothetical protein
MAEVKERFSDRPQYHEVVSRFDLGPQVLISVHDSHLKGGPRRFDRRDACPIVNGDRG